MERRYDILFTVSIRHQGMNGRPVPGISIRPTSDCHYQLQRHNMLFKANDLGGLIIMEKLAQGVQSLNPTRPFDDLVEFTFVLENQNTDLLRITEPFASQKFNSQVTGGYCLYFDNLDPRLSADTRAELASDGTASTLADVFHVYPEKWAFPAAKSSEIQAKALKPGGKTLVFKPERPNSAYVDVILPFGAYEIDLKDPLNVHESALVYPGLNSLKPMGLIRIFKTPETNYEQQKDYTVTLRNKI